MKIEIAKRSIASKRHGTLRSVIWLFLIWSCATRSGVVDYNQGVSLLASGRSAEAIVALERAREADPTWSDVRLALGKAYADAAKPLEAWIEFREAFRLEPRNEEARLQLQRSWEQYRKRGVLAKGASMEEVRSALGEPDSILDHYGGYRRVLWVYGRYGIEFRREKIYELREP